MMYLLINILLISIIIFLCFFAYYDQIKQNKSHREIIVILNKNIDFLLEYYKRDEITQIRNDIQLYSCFQIISKISKCDYVSLFKYDYSKRYIILHLLLLMDNNGNIIKEKIFEDLPITGELLRFDMLNIDDSINSLCIDNNMIDDNVHIHTIIESKGINKIYYQNIFKNDINPFGIISISYKDKGFELTEDDKVQISRVIENMKCCI